MSHLIGGFVPYLSGLPIIGLPSFLFSWVHVILDPFTLCPLLAYLSMGRSARTI